ncbi:unnamed protein product [Protopolystoma xenopodis]|uniref:Uncharacterized protein n=1 Tax=Protopolystoma xenopodis TaxID=117903 RepID=A0A3S5CV63_9PLAT|nr:unnamed protein product [Protopolystoma xenopodis]
MGLSWPGYRRLRLAVSMSCLLHSLESSSRGPLVPVQLSLSEPNYEALFQPPSTVGLRNCGRSNQSGTVV